MAQFCMRVNERIESLTSWEETIERIDELNDLILEALKERIRYPVCRNCFDITLNKDKNAQKELEAKGIDTLWWGPVYSRVIEKICPEGNYADSKVVEAESRLEELVFERIMIGRKVIEYKASNNIAVTRKHREEKIIAHARAYASENEMGPDAVEDIFRFMMEKNKDIQNLYISRNTVSEASKSRNGF